MNAPRQLPPEIFEAAKAIVKAIDKIPIYMGQPSFATKVDAINRVSDLLDVIKKELNRQ